MTTPIHDLEAQVLGSGFAERARLLERLLESFEPDSTIEKAWIAEALSREADVKSGLSAINPGSQALARVRAKLA